jgi:hypothetical protein
MQDTGDQPDDVTVSPEAAPPTAPERVDVVVVLDGDYYYEKAYANAHVNLMLVWRHDDLHDEAGGCFVAEVDDERFAIETDILSPDDPPIDDRLAKALKAVGIEVPDLLAAEDESEATPE